MRTICFRVIIDILTFFIFYTPHFLHSAFSTLRIFYTLHFLHSPLFEVRIFHTPHCHTPAAFSAFSTFRIFYTPQSAYTEPKRSSSRMFKTNLFCLVTTEFPLRQFCLFIRRLDIQKTEWENFFSQSISCRSP